MTPPVVSKRRSTGEVDLRRIKTSQKWYNRYIVQHIYIPVIYALLGVKTRYATLGREDARTCTAAELTGRRSPHVRFAGSKTL